MSQQIHADLHPELRVQALKDEAISVVSEKYFQNISEDDRRTGQHELLMTLDQMDDVASEAAEAAKGYKETISGLSKHAKTLRQNLRTGRQEVTGQLYGIPDYSTNKVNFYAPDGTWIRSRNLLPEERQPMIEFGGMRASAS